MAFPNNVGVVDLMLNVPARDRSEWYEFLAPLLLDEESRRVFEMPAEYLFKNIPRIEEHDDYVAFTVAEMDRHGIDMAMVGVDETDSPNRQAVERYPQRFFGSYHANPNRAMDEVRKIERLHRE